MKNHLSNTRRGDSEQDPTDLDLLQDPLEFIHEDHMHMRAVCELMERISHNSLPDPVEISRLLRFLDHEIGLLIHDEDDELQGMLLVRCTPEDDIGPTLERLKVEHQTLSELCPRLRTVLTEMHDDKRAAKDDEAAALRDFADRLRRHLIVENAIVLPIAQARLTDDDIVRLRNAMIRRRIEDMQV
ncbi:MULTISPECIES: hemerythrin domain-containing protein [Rhodobacterales]|uniref:Hemerythrin-like domain-containing protein n=1 Tax=Paenirhodobacter hankyongi TaxID=2294033 RepID=A0A421BKP5_9RHOB|nr:hemerythrin domain-containing protein [Sinirhodobacter hankyongi]RLL62928.1 hypothetical protein DYS74_15765 [Sinirhodobacter hankyongi]